MKCLRDEVGNGSSVAGSHPLPVGVEDPRDASIDAGAVIGHGVRLSASLRFVVHAAYADRVDVAPVVLRLRMHRWVSVHLRGRGEQESSALLAGQLEQRSGSGSTRVQGCDW